MGANPLAELSRLPIIEKGLMHMLSWKLLGIAGFAAGLATSAALATATTPQADGRAQYAPIQSISYVFGSKSMSGYFVRESGACAVTLMISEKSDPDDFVSTTPTRVRLVLNPGQAAGLDSQEGRSLNMTCGAGAATLLVDAGERAAAPYARKLVESPRRLGTAVKPAIVE